MTTKQAVDRIRYIEQCYRKRNLPIEAYLIEGSRVPIPGRETGETWLLEVPHEFPINDSPVKLEPLPGDPKSAPSEGHHLLSDGNVSSDNS